MDKKTENFIEQKGWTIVCESPLEIEYVCPDNPQDGVIGFASGVAAKTILANLEKEAKKSFKKKM